MRKLRIGINCFLATLMMVLMIDCGQEVVTVPTVLSTIPTNGATDVGINTTVSATFNMKMSPASISTSSFMLRGAGGAAVAGAVAYNGVTATFTPASALNYGAVYTATITTKAKSLGGASLGMNYVWTFTTIAPPPLVIATVPENGATGVPIDQVLSATFNEAMNCATFSSPATAFTVTGPGVTAVAGKVTCSGAVATFTPRNALASHTLFTATIGAGVKSLAGTSLAGGYRWSFITAAASAPPTVISTVPVNGATGVPVNRALSATFSLAMNPATIDAATFKLTRPGGAAVKGIVTYTPAGSVATFTPDSNLAASTLYKATITIGARDLEAMPLAKDYVWTFTTGVAIDKTSPTVISTNPADLATDVPLNQIVSATFSKAMNAATMTAANFTLKGPGATAVSGLVAYAAISDSITFAPTEDLAPGTQYKAEITTGATDLAGNALVADYIWTFTTGTSSDNTEPEIVSTVPANLAKGVALNQAVSATFSEAMNPLTITPGTFKLTGPGDARVDATLTYDPISFIATLTPVASFADNTTYTATVTNGAADLAGTSLGDTGAPNPWTFTTGTTTKSPPIDLGTSAFMGAFGGTAGITNQGVYTVVNGDIGTTAVSTLITGFHDDLVVVAGVPECIYTQTPLNIGFVNGTIDTAPPPPTVGCPNEGTAITYAVAEKAAKDALAAYNALVALPNGMDVSTCPGCGGGLAGELGNRTLAPGVYKSAPGSYAISQGDLTLDAKGDANAVWVFQMATTLTVGTPSSNRSVLLVNGAQAKNVFWQVGTAATINGILGGGTMQGTIISQSGVSISTAGVKQITTLNGRAMVLVGSVTVVNTVINVPAP
jgi:hypothetical protein